MAARSISIVVVNCTPINYSVSAGSPSHGKWSSSPASSCGQYQTITCGLESDGFLTGCEATMTLSCDPGTLVTLNMNNPYAGSNSYSGSCTNANYMVSRYFGSGNNAQLVWVISPVV